MLGLFGTLNLSTRALQTQQAGVEVASHNLANVNNPAYARQRLLIQTSPAVQTALGSIGTGVEAAGVIQLRDALLDQQIAGENSVSGFLEAQQAALKSLQANLGERLEDSAASINGAEGAGSVGSAAGLGNSLAGLFNAFQQLSASPAALGDRQAVISQARQLATQFNQFGRRLDGLNTQLNQSVQAETDKANQLLSDIAELNNEIASAEVGSRGAANDLRDMRQQKLEDLSKMLNFTSSTAPDGTLDISVDGQLLVAGATVRDTLQTYDAGSGKLLLRAAASSTPITLTGGRIQGTIDARDGTLQSVRDGINQLASELITSVNAVYQPGYDLGGGTGAVFFTGANASDIGVNAALATDASKLQVSGLAGASGDNQVALALARMGNTRQAALGNRTFAESYQGTITAVGFSLSSVNGQLEEQEVLQGMLETRRSAVSGVSLDEEMADLVKFQRSFQASARLVSTIDEMLNEVVNLK
jgi:flagellar hook-associated protein 1 FlgK